MTNRQIKLMLRAFNGECDAAILKARWNNANQMEARIKKAFEAINKMGETNDINIQRGYMNLKLEELYLAHEYQNKRHEEQEEQRAIREQIREEEKRLREIEKLKKQAEDEQRQYEKALRQAKADLAKAHGGDIAKAQALIDSLEEKLKEALANSERALSMAQLTRAGHVYVISNIGSFGEGTYKIGMTRRLEPLDRVRELGDASVPFTFDVHAMIYSEDAPTLEKALHDRFDAHRVNLVNSRKEFFRVHLKDITEEVKKHNGEVHITQMAEAQEYRETMSMRENNGKREMNINSPFPASID